MTSQGDQEQGSYGPEAREQLLRFYLSLANPTRVCVIDALKAWGALSEKELGRALVATGDIAEQSKPNLGRLHLKDLVDAKLIEKFIDDADGEVRYREGEAMRSGVPYFDDEATDEELAAASYEFARVLTERRTRRLAWWERMRWEWEGWETQGITMDNVVQCTDEDVQWYTDRIEEINESFQARIEERHKREGASGEWPYFRVVTLFPFGEPGGTPARPIREW